MSNNIALFSLRHINNTAVMACDVIAQDVEYTGGQKTAMRYHFT